MEMPKNDGPASDTEEPSDAYKEQAYIDAVLAAMERVSEGLEKGLENGVQFPTPIPPNVAKAAILQAIFLAGFAFAENQGIPLPIVKEVFDSSLKLNTQSKLEKS